MERNGKEKEALGKEWKGIKNNGKEWNDKEEKRK